VQVSDKVIRQLDETLNKVIISFYNDNKPVANNKCEFVVGNTIIKRENTFYNVYDKNTNEVLYQHLYLIEAALIIARCHNIRNYSKLRDILSLDNKYAKYYLDMKNYLHTFKTSIANEQYSKAEVAEIRYRDAKAEVARARKSIKTMSDQIIKNR